MGFDLYGINPKLTGPKPDITWSSASEEERLNYFQDMQEFEAENPGYYFRNNVWWWGPLWAFVAKYCKDILSIEDIDAGNYNDGYEIDQQKAIDIGNRLLEVLENGDGAVFNLMFDEAKATDSEQESVKHYYFDQQNVRKFAIFCLNSGGFTIN